MNNMLYPRNSIWLLPTKEDKVVLQQIIDTLSQEFNAPRFAPHATLFSWSTSDDQPAEGMQLLEEIAEMITPITLKVKGIGMNDNLFESLFLEVESNNELSILFRKFSHMLGGDYQFHPHISLLYKDVSAAEKTKAIKKIQLPKTITVDRLGFKTHKDEDDRMDIDHWKIKTF